MATDSPSVLEKLPVGQTIVITGTDAVTSGVRA
jgi:hypothetical protein